MSFSDHFRSQLTDPQFRLLWEGMRPSLRIIAMIKSARQLYGWSQGDLARKMGVSRAKIKRVEMGTDVLTDTFVAKFFMVFVEDESSDAREPGVVELQSLASKRV